MKTRILKLNLKEHIEGKKLAQTALAAEIGIAPLTLKKMLNNEWDYVTRESIERTADYFELEVPQIFEFVPVNFWKWIEDKKQCNFLRGSPNALSEEGELTMPGSDLRATSVVFPLIHQLGKDAARFFDHELDKQNELDRKKLIDRAMRENCIAIGSPKSNSATEILLSHFFGAEPFNSAQENRWNVPFGFCWPEVSKLEQDSTLTCSDKARARAGTRAGIAVKNGPVVEADYMDAAEFTKWTPAKMGRDCGLVFVANKPFGTPNEVKLIVLAGFSGLGTLGAAKALMRDFRYLEPTSKKGYVFGVVQVLYTKPADSETRTYKRFEWKFRTGIVPINEKSNSNGTRKKKSK